MESNQIRVLLIEDDAGDALLARRALSQVAEPAYQVELVTSLAGAERELGASRYDVALLDLGLPESSGIDTIARFRALCTEPLPVIVLTSLDDQQAALESLDKGAQDYLVKDSYTPDALSRAIRYALQRQQLLAELQSANELLKSKNQRLSELYNTAQQFVDNVSHEFRTPLTVIREFTSIVRDRYDGPVTLKQIEHLDKVLHRTDDLALMVDDMLDISKLEAGLLGVWRRPCSVAELTKNVVGLLRARAESKRIRLTAQADAGLPEVFCDEEKAQRVLINLTVNAIKFTPEEGRVEIWARPGQDGDEVVVGVTDSGAGICRNNLEAIFERFRQVEVNLRASTKGFGLGLNIAKELVQLNLGEICVESEVGAGSTFSFTLPRNDPAIIFDRYISRRANLAEDCPWLSLLTVSIERSAMPISAPVVDEFLQRSVRAHDLVLPAAAGGWLIAASCAEKEYPNLIARLAEGWDEYVRNCPTAELPPLEFEFHNTYLSCHDAAQVRSEFERLIARPAALPAAAKTVLVVDDDREVNSCLGVRLEAAGYQVMSAFDGEQGLSAALSGHPDAVVLDVRMPNKDGLAMLREMRTHVEVRDTPVVVLSASVRDQHRALKAGANYFVTKPYEAREVLLAIESSLSPCKHPPTCAAPT